MTSNLCPRDGFVKVEPGTGDSVCIGDYQENSCTELSADGKLSFSLYAIKVACTAGKKKATLFLETIGSGAIRYQIKKGR